MGSYSSKSANYGYQFILLLLIVPVIFFLSCRHETVLTFTGSGDDPVLKYAASELRTFLPERYLNEAKNSGITTVEFNLSIESGLPEAAFGIDSKYHDGKLTVVLSGSTSSDVLYAAYTFLEKGGCFFDITGPVYPDTFDWESVKNYSEEIVPTVKKRGIRQHLNFPMDLSAWSLADAKGYIRNLSRMRFNSMTFHSYPGQWYEVKRKDTTEYAGHFFYGDVHLVPDYQPIKAIAVNKKYYCIPEIEPYFEDQAKRSKMAIEWLREVMTEARKTGMEVQFSFEPRVQDTAIGRTAETVGAILKEYPMIDALELITEEAGGWGPQTTRENTEKVIVDHFGRQYLKDSVIMQPVRDKQSDLAYIYGQIGHNAKLIRYLKENRLVPDNLSLVLGIYVVIPDYAAPAYYLAGKLLPEDEISVLSGYGSRSVNNNIPKILKDEDDRNRAIIYSWIELDGMMYLQQNGIGGIHDIVAQSVKNTSDHRAHAILFNHWRTAENKVTARYAAQSGIYGAVDPSDFYRHYAAAHGIGDTEGFALAMQDLEQADIASINNVNGMGFCWTGRWRKGGPVAGYSVEKLKTVQAAYMKVLDDLKRCSPSAQSQSARQLIALLDNRIRTTVIYLKAFEKARGLAPYHAKKELSEAEQQEYVRICNESLAILEQYIDVYASINADRGCSGNLVSLWYGPVKALKYLREKYGGIPFDNDIPEGTAVDAPPLPIINYN